MTASKAVALPLGDRPTVLIFISVACWVVTRLFKSERMVRKERLELSHLAAPEPKSGASTNSATSAYCQLRITVVSLIVLFTLTAVKMKNNGAEGET